MTRTTRAVARLVPAVVLAAAAGLAILHTPAVRMRVVAWGLERLRSDVRVDVRVEQATYNLFALTARLSGVTASAVGAPQPFAAAEDVFVDVAWRTLFGGDAEVQALELSGLTITIVRSPDGSLNLPEPRSTGGTRAVRVPIGRILAENAHIGYRDRTADWGIDVEGLSLALTPSASGAISGRLQARPGVRIETGAVVHGRGTLDGQVAYDGASLTLNRLRYEAPEGQFALDGRLESLWSAPRAQLDVTGTVDLMRVSSTVSLDPPVGGELAFRSTITGPLSDPRASASIETGAISWRHLGPASLRARSTVGASGVELDDATVEVDGGTVNLSGRYAFDTREAALHAGWQSLPATSLAGPTAPFPLATRLNGRADATWTGTRNWSGLRITADNRSVPVADGGGGVTVAGEASLELNGGIWRLRHDHVLGNGVRVAGGVAGRLADPLRASQQVGTLEVTGDDLSRALPLVRALGISVPARARPEAGRLTASLVLGGTVGAPELNGELVVDDATLPDTGPIDLESSIAFDGRHVALDRFRVIHGADRATGSAALDLERRTLRGNARVELADLASLTRAIAEPWRPTGAVSGQIEIEGRMTRPVVRGTITGAGLTLAGQQIAHLSAGLEYADGNVKVRALDLRQPSGGRLSMDGQYTIETGGFQVIASAADIALRSVTGLSDDWPVSAVLTGRFQGRGTLDHPSGSGRISVARLSWGQVALGSADVDLTVADASARLDGTFVDLSTNISATVGLRSPHGFTLAAEAREADIARLFRDIVSRAVPAGARFEGSLSTKVEASGTLENPSAATVGVELRHLNVVAADARLELVQPVTIRYASRSLAIGPLQLRTGSSVIEASGRLGEAAPPGSLDAVFRGRLGDIRRWLPPLGAGGGIEFDGMGTVRVSASGSLDRPSITGQVQVEAGTLGVAPYPAVTGVEVDAELRQGLIEVARLGARWEGTALTARSTIPLPLLSGWLPKAITEGAGASAIEATLSGRVDGLTARALEPFAGPGLRETLDADIGGAIDLRADALSPERVQGTLTLDRLVMSAGGVPITQVRPTRFVVAGGRIRIADWSWEAAGNQLAVTGQAGLIGDHPLDLRAAGRVDLRVLGAFVPHVTAGGLADVSVDVGGSLTDPLLDGSVEIRGGELRVADPRILLANAAGRISLQGRRLRIESFGGTLNGGRLTAAGELAHDAARVSGALTFTGTDVALNVPEGLRTEADADLTLTLAGDRARVSGRMTIERGAYREPLSLAVGLVTTLRRKAIETTGGSPSAALDRLDLDVAVASRNDLIVDNNYGRMEIGLDLRVVGTAARPSVVGRATIREGGLLYLGARPYQIETGTIDFTNPRELVPDLNLTARTRISGYDITLGVSGTPATARATLSSDPPLGQSDIASLLVTGRRVDALGGASTTVAREQMLSYLSGEALGFAARAVRLDTLRLERGATTDEFQSDPSLIAGEADPASRLTLSKRVSRDLEVVLSQNLRQGGQLTWILAYEPLRNVELRGLSRDDRSRSYEVRHSVILGEASVEPAAAARADGLTDRRITAVRFVGDSGFTANELGGEISLGAGERFDFYRWQRDRDRLRQLYVEGGYLEAGIYARRLDAGDAAGQAGLVLEYEIDRGPRTRLQIDGHPLPGALVRELEALWADAVFDEALFADLVRAVRLHIAGEGFLQARVTAGLAGQPSSGEKRIAISIVPGGRVMSRRISFAGNHEVPVARLEALAAARDHGLRPWLEPMAFVRDVAELYRDEGFFAARVAAEPIDYTGGNAALLIRIAEGSRFVVSSVTVAGMEAQPEEEIRRAFGVDPGTPYTPAAIERSRRAVDAYYGRHGFNAVRSAVGTEMDLAAGTVRVTLTVEEGPRQILTDVAVAGGEGLRPHAVTDVLKLDPGTPVDMDDWYQARRRLLDTGLFRSVDIEAVPLEREGAGPAVEPVQARVTLERWPLWRLRYGLDVTDEAAPAADRRTFGAGLVADASRRSVFGRAGTVGSSVRVNADERILRGFLAFPSLFALPVTTNLFTSRSRESIAETGFFSIITDKTTFTAEQRVRLRGSMQVSYGYRLERNHTFDPNADPTDPFAIVFDETVTAGRLTATTTVDTRNDPFDAVRGLFHSSAFEYAPEALGSDVRFAKYFVQQFFYWPLGRGPVVASGIRLGIGTAFGQDLLSSERFFAGGANTIRGFPDNSLGERDVLGAPAGGGGVLILNQELRVPIYRWFRGAGFIDAGNVFTRASDLSLGDLAVGAGGGLRISTPMGLFRLDLGIPLGGFAGARTPRWHFSFGQAF